MKAVLEFNYPEDEERLRCAMHGVTAINALTSIQQAIYAWERHKGLEPNDLIDEIKSLVINALEGFGDR